MRTMGVDAGEQVERGLPLSNVQALVKWQSRAMITKGSMTVL